MDFNVSRKHATHQPDSLSNCRLPLFFGHNLLKQKQTTTTTPLAASSGNLLPDSPNPSPDSLVLPFVLIYTLNQWFSAFSMHENHLEDSFHHRFPVPPLELLMQ